MEDQLHDHPTGESNAVTAQIDWERAYRELEEQIARIVFDIADAADRAMLQPGSTDEGTDRGRLAALEKTVTELNHKNGWLRRKLSRADARALEQEAVVADLHRALQQVNGQVGELLGMLSKRES
ncbi:hypothetical protein BJH93_09130 [Kocuria polaris]|nr:hypothetical protein [Kocuria polaris]